MARGLSWKWQTGGGLVSVLLRHVEAVGSKSCSCEGADGVQHSLGDRWHQLADV